jgi:hypothetical protein
MSRSFRFVLVLFVWLAGVTLSATAQTNRPVAATEKTVVPKGTPIVVQTYNAINSATFHVGESLAYTVTSDVIVNGLIVAKAGDMASGAVLDAQQGRKVRAGAVGHLAGPVGTVAGAAVNKAASKGADLRVSVDKVRTFCGDTIPLAFVRSEYHKPRRFQKMTSVEIAKGQKYEVTVAQDTTVCGVATSEAPAPIPRDALRADPS